RAVNAIRQAGSVAAAVEKNLLTSGIMHACVRNNVDVVLTGSIRDEGSFPGATTDAIEGQKVLREKLADVTHALLLASIRHSLAAGCMLWPTLQNLCAHCDSPPLQPSSDHPPFQ